MTHVVVVGGGVMGCSVAFHLKRLLPAALVTIVERNLRVASPRGSNLRHHKIATVLCHCGGTATWDTGAPGGDPVFEELDLDHLKGGRYLSKKPAPAAPVQEAAAPLPQPAAPLPQTADPVLAAIAKLDEKIAKMDAKIAKMDAKLDEKIMNLAAETKAGFQMMRDQHHALVSRKGRVMARNRIGELVQSIDDFDVVTKEGAYVGRLQGGQHTNVDGAIVHMWAEEAKDPPAHRQGLRVHAFDSILDLGDAAADV